MSPLEAALFALALATGAAAGVLAVLGRGPPRLRRAWLGVALGALAVLVGDRWRRAGHPPIMGTYEVALADALVLWALALGWAWRRPAQARVAVALGIPGAAMLGHGLAFPTAPVPLTISEQSLWVDLHAFVAFLALGLYLSGAAAAVGRLLVRDEASEDGLLLDEAQHRFTALGFLFHSALMATGAWYSVHVFGVFWRWDPIEALAALSWLAWGLALHARLFFRWRGKRLAVALLLCVLVTVALHKGVPHLGRLSFHVFDLRFPGAPG